MNEAEMQKEAERARKRNYVVFGVFAALLILLIAAVCVYMVQHSYSPQKWDADKENRYKFVSDMLEKNPLTDMTEAEVIDLLGEEDGGEHTSFKGNKTFFPPESTLVYWLGVDFIDDNWLVISIDGGTVSSYCIGLT